MIGNVLKILAILVLAFILFSLGVVYGIKTAIETLCRELCELEEEQEEGGEQDA